MKKAFLLLFGLIFITAGIASADEDLLLKGKYKEAYTQYNNELNIAKTPINYLQMCKVTFALQDTETAKNYCRLALKEIEKEKTPDYELKSEILSSIGDIYSTAYHNIEIPFEYYNKAKEYKEKNEETDKYNLAKLYKNIGYTYGYTGNENLAQRYWDKAINTIENSAEEKNKMLLAEIYNDKAEFENKKENFNKEKEFLDAAVENAENSGEYLNRKELAKIYLNMAKYYEVTKKDKKKALEYYQKQIKETSMFPEEDLLTKEDNMPDDTTIEDIEAKLSEYPYEIDLNIMAGSYYVINNEKRAKEFFEKAIAVNPENPYIYAAISSTYAEKYANVGFREYADGAKKYAELAKQYANYEPDIYLNLGVISLNLKAIIAANAYFNEYIKYSKDKASAYCEIAAVFWYNDPKMKLRKYVVYYLEKAKKISELNNTYKLMLASAYKQIGNKNKANDTATELIKDKAINND